MRDEPDDAQVLMLRAGVKAEIRARRRAVRRALPTEAREARSRAICERVIALPEWARAKSVAAFVSMRTEVQTRLAVEAAWADGKSVATPRMAPSFDELELRAWREDTPLEESGMMFLQPPESADLVAPEAIDLVLVPALAVDDRGHRIGFGKGFYDRLLPRLTSASRVAVIFDFERVAEVPELPGDEPVDVIVTDERVLRPARA